MSSPVYQLLPRLSRCWSWTLHLDQIEAGADRLRNAFYNISWFPAATLFLSHVTILGSFRDVKSIECTNNTKLI